MPESIVLAGQRHPLSLPDDWGTIVCVYDILLDDCYGLERLRDVRTVLDIGAHAGLFCLAAREHFPDAIIHAYEPNPEMHPNLRRHAEVSNATWFPEAVGADAQTVRVVRGDISYTARVESDATSTIRQIPFTEALERLGGAVDLVKIDAEGAEHQLLADPELWRDVRYLTLEYHDDARRTLLDRVRDAGFSVLAHQTLADDGLLLCARGERA